MTRKNNNNRIDLLWINSQNVSLYIQMLFFSLRKPNTKHTFVQQYNFSVPSILAPLINKQTHTHIVQQTLWPVCTETRKIIINVYSKINWKRWQRQRHHSPSNAHTATSYQIIWLFAFFSLHRILFRLFFGCKHKCFVIKYIRLVIKCIRYVLPCVCVCVIPSTNCQ